MEQQVSEEGSLDKAEPWLGVIKEKDFDIFLKVALQRLPKKRSSFKLKRESVNGFEVFEVRFPQGTMSYHNQSHRPWITIEECTFFSWKGYRCGKRMACQVDIDVLYSGRIPGSYIKLKHARLRKWVVYLRTKIFGLREKEEKRWRCIGFIEL